MKQRNLKMEKNKLISFLNLIPDDVRCNIHGEYNGIGYECLVDVWCGKYLIRGWKDKIDNGSSIDEIMSSYVSDNWNCVSTDYDDDIVKGALFDSYIEEAREALKIDWDAKIRKEIEKYIESKPNEKQISLANAINLALKKNAYFSKHMSKSDYDKFIRDNMNEYNIWLEQHNPKKLGY